MSQVLLRDLQPGTDYAIQVRSNTGDAVSQWSRRFLIFTEADVTPPDVPTWIATNPWKSDGSSFLATWNAVNGTLDQNVDLAFYELTMTAGGTSFTVTTQNTAYVLSYAENVARFGSPQPVVLAKVRAVDQVGNRSAYTAELTATNAPPPSVANLVTTALYDSISIKWDTVAIDDFKSYVVQVSTGGVGGTYSTVYEGDANTYVHSTTSWGVDHFYRVFVKDIFNTLSPSVTSSAVRPKSAFNVDTIPPAVPTALAASITANTDLRSNFALVSWTHTSESDLSGFNLRYRKAGSADNWTILTVDRDTRSVKIDPLPVGINFDFQIRAFDYLANYSAYTGVVTANAPANAVPGQVVGLTALPGKDSITYNWTALTDPDLRDYEVTFSTSSTFASGNTTFFNGTSTNLTVSGLTPSTSYYARVRAVDTAGQAGPFSTTNTSATTAYPSANATDGQAPQSSPTPTVTGRLAHLYVSWSPVTLNALGAAQKDTVTYEVHMSTTTGFTPAAGTKVTEVSGTSAVIDVLPGTTTPLTYGTTYYVKLIAKDADAAAAAGAQGSGIPTKTASTDVISIGADLIVPGTGIINNLVINTGGGIQSSNYAAGTTGWRISPTGVEMNDANSKVSAAALQGGTISATSQIILGPSANLIVNGGYIQSNTYTAGSAGYRISTSGIEMNDANSQISVAALKSGSLTTQAITLTGTATITGGTWSLSNSGLTIPDGGIIAQKIMLQDGQNVIRPEYADFEGSDSWWSAGNVVGSNAIVAKNATSKFNTQSLGAIWGTAPANPVVWLGKSTTDYNIPVEAGQAYIFSAWAWCAGAVPTNIQLKVKWSNAAIATLTLGAGQASTATLTASGVPATATRLSGYVTVPAGVTGAIIHFESSTLTSGGGFNVDGVQVERKTTFAHLPSPWTPPGITRIDGSIIRTGAIESTVKDNTITSVWDTATATFVTGPGQPLWSINTSGNASFRDLLVKGRILVGDGTETTSALATVSSTNYRKGALGWMIRSDGSSEFRQMTADSLDAKALKAGTFVAEMISSGTIKSDILIGASMRSTETQALTVTTKQITSNVATLTLSQDHERVVGDRIQVKMDTADATFDTPGNTYDTITAVTANTISYARTAANVTPVAATGTVTATGRSVLMDPTGITLYNNDGVGVVVKLPTNPAEDAYFAGNISATSLEVINNFLLQGTGNSLAAGGVLTMQSGIMPPTLAPTASHSWDFVSTWLNDQYTLGKFGLMWEGTCWVTANEFGSGQAMAYGATNGTFVYNSNMAGTANFAAPRGGIAKSSAYNYALTQEYDTGNWTIFQYDAAVGTGWDTPGPAVFSTGYNSRLSGFFPNTSVAEWRGTMKDANSGLKNPSIGVGAIAGVTYVFIARPNKEGRIVITRYNLDGTGQTEFYTNVYDNQNIMSVNVGQFDFGGDRLVVTTEGSGTKSATNYVFTVGASFTHSATETWSSPYSNKLIGTGWNGTKWASLGENRSHFWYTSLAKNVATTWSAKSTWFDGSNTRTVNVTNKQASGNVATINTSTAHGWLTGDVVTLANVDALLNGPVTITGAPTTTSFTFSTTASIVSTPVTGTATNEFETAFSAATSFTAIRRAKLSLTAGSIPNGGKPNDPDRPRFYVSSGASSSGTHYRQAEVASGMNYIQFSDTPTFSGTTAPNAAGFPAMTPAKFKSSNGMLELSADGTAIFGSSTDASVDPGNKPALRVGDISGLHLRIDGNEILAMATDSSRGALNLNLGGGVRIGAGRLMAGFDSGYGAYAPTAGVITVPHDMGAIPNTAVAISGSHFGQTTMYLYDKGSSTSTVMKFYVRDADTNVAVTNTRTISWFAVL